MPSLSDLSVQLYTVRAALAADPDATLERLAGLGFRLVEPFDLLTFRDSLATGLAKHGLSAPTTHADILGQDRASIFAAAQALGIRTVIQPWLDPGRWRREEDIATIASELDAAAEAASAFGLRIGYHNHEFELKSRIGDRHALEVLADRLSPAVVLEVDTWWARIGGADVPALLRRLGDRVAALHLKDGDGSDAGHHQLPLGQGVLPVREILEAAPGALRVIELDGTEGDVFDAIRIGRDLLVEIAGG